MTPEEFNLLRPGDVVCGKSSGETYIVMAHYGTHVAASRHADITHPSEWDLVAKSVLRASICGDTPNASPTECLHCGKQFETGPGTGRRLDAKFCSSRHQIAFNSKKRSRQSKHQNGAPA